MVKKTIIPATKKLGKELISLSAGVCKTKSPHLNHNKTRAVCCFKKRKALGAYLLI